MFLLLPVGPAVHASPQPGLVPLPKSVSVIENKPGFSLDDTLLVSIPSGDPVYRDHFRAFGDALARLNQCKVRFAEDSPGVQPDLSLTLNPSLAPAEYHLAVGANRIRIEASTLKGTAHATATLLQLIGSAAAGTLSQVVIHDQPTCRYRNFMVDVGRNPLSLECLKETIDLLWFYKLDSLQLHLTDDQRFAFPSKAFPKLVTRSHMISWNEFKQLDHYARARGISIIPELEVPGHSTLLRRHYPEVFGKTPTDLAKLPSARKAIKVLLDEMIDVFASSPYVHIGGDEAYGVPTELQRDLINDLHAHLKQRGKKTIVWEGPGLGRGTNKVSTEVIHINWRTINFPADQMLAAGYPVINASWDPLYIVDHYPRNNFTMAAPQHIYETLDLRRFKHFNPGIPTFHKPVVVEPNDRLLGFCMPWWEGREINYFPLIVPRVIPMAAVAWNTAGEKDYADFEERSTATEQTRLRAFHPCAIEASPLALETEGVFHHRTTVTLSSRVPGTLRYTLDGTDPGPDSARYTGPFVLNRTTTVRAAVFGRDGQIGYGSRRTFVMVEPVANLALGKPVTASVPSGPLFSPARLTDGGTGNLDFFLGYPAVPEPIAITVDLEAPRTFDRIVVHSYTNGRSYESYELEVSLDGKMFTRVASRLEKPDPITPRAVHDLPPTRARYVRVLTHGHKGQVFDSFSRLTEIQVFAARAGHATR